jgi:hypothetical protein
MNADVKSFLDDLKQVNDASTVSIKVPSTSKKATFRKFNVTQQKKLLKSAFDGVQGSIESLNVFNNIVKDNCQDDVDFLLCDRIPILLELRKATSGNTFLIDEKDYDLSELPIFNIKDVNLTATIEDSGIEATCKVPTLDTDIKINKKIIAEIGKLTREQQEKQSIELVLTYEIIKYVDAIKLGETSLNFNDLSVYERVKVVNELPLSLNNSIIDYISGVKKVEDKCLTFDDDAVVNIDAGFLAAD